MVEPHDYNLLLDILAAEARSEVQIAVCSTGAALVCSTSVHHSDYTCAQYSAAELLR